MKRKLKRVMVLFGAVCILNTLVTGCAFGTKSDVVAEEGIPEEISAMPVEDRKEDTEEPQESTAGKWQVLDPETAAAFDADFIGKVWKIEEDSFFIAETKVRILDDGSLASSSPSSNAELPDSQLIQVVFDDDTCFYIRTIYDNGESYEDEEAGFQDLEEHMSVAMKGRFENDVFYATKIRLSKIS